MIKIKKIFILLIVILLFENKVKAKELTTFEKAFKEVAYAYYMRGPYLNYNVAKGKGNILSPEESTSQDNNYMACALYVMNVYKELLGVNLSYTDGSYTLYAGDYVGKRKEVIGYGKRETDDSPLKWYDGTLDSSGKPVVVKENPDQDYIISQLKIGDILDYSGHVMLVYDYVYDDDGNIIDVYLINSTTNGYYITNTKTHGKISIYKFEDGKDPEQVAINLGHGPNSNIYYLNYSKKDILDSGTWEDLRPNEGTVQLETLKYRANNINNYLKFDPEHPEYYSSKYAIIRFVTTDENGNDRLSLDGTFHDGHSGAFKDDKYDDEIINYSDSVKSRLKYNRIYIEKTVDKRDDNIVEPNEELTYKITVKNNSDKNYSEDIIVIENISEYVDYLNYNSNKNVTFNKDNNILTFNIGKLNAGEEIELTYKVKVKKGFKGQTIESTGKVANIPSGTVKNTIGTNIRDNNSIKTSYEKLKDKYTGKKLINEIYKDALGLDLELDDFNYRASNENDKNGLIYFNDNWGSWSSWIDPTYMSISKENKYSDMVLNSYFNILYKNVNGINTKDINGNTFKAINYALPAIGLKENDPDNRADTIYPTDFKTGDILMYLNQNDYKYSLKSGTQYTYAKPITKEIGEYWYIYIEGKGFVGVNLGNDETSGTSDDRNEFNSKYYEDNNLNIYTKSDNANEEIMTDELKEWMQYQSLFGKDYYVILRPSLIMNELAEEFEVLSPNTGSSFDMKFLFIALLFVVLGIFICIYPNRKKLKNIFNKKI